MIATIDDMHEWLGADGIFDTPEVILTCSYDCSIHCSCCFLNEMKPYMKGKVLSKENCEKVIKWAVDHDYPLYTGAGEPFFWWDYTRDVIIPLMKKYKAKIMFSSNGKFGEDPKVLEEAVNAGIEYLSLSVDPWHNVPVRTVNKVLEAFEPTSTLLLISQITDVHYPIGTVRPKYYDKMVKIEWPIGHNHNESQKVIGHDFDGNILLDER